MTTAVETLLLMIESLAVSLLINSELEIDYKTQTKKIIDELCEYHGFNYLGEGGKRLGLLSPDKKMVYKIPKNGEGIYDNLREVNIYQDSLPKKYNKSLDAYKTIYAGCKLYNSVVTIMEYVNPDVPQELLDEPGNEWVDCIDCQQVGIVANKRLVAYDYA